MLADNDGELESPSFFFNDHNVLPRFLGFVYTITVWAGFARPRKPIALLSSPLHGRNLEK